MSREPRAAPAIGALLSRIAEVLRLVWPAGRRWSMALLALMAMQSAVPALILITLREAAGGARPSTVPMISLLPAVAAGALLIAGQAIASGAKWIRTVQADRVEQHVLAIIHDQCTRVGLRCFDSPEFYDRLYRARTEAPARITAFLDGTVTLVQSTLALAALSAVAVSYSGWMAAAVGVAVIPGIGLAVRQQLILRRWKRENTVRERQACYYDWLLTSREAAPESRLFSLGGRFRAAYSEIRREIGSGAAQLARCQAMAELSSAAFGLLLLAGCGFYYWRMHSGSGAPETGSILVGAQALYAAFTLARSAAEGLASVYSNSLFAGELIEFLAIDREPDAERANERGAVQAPDPLQLRRSIRFRNVRFRYPGSDHDALRDVDLEIPAGGITALVGWNGSGKTTLLKLLCRFYDPTGGAIELDGADIRTLPLDRLRRSLSAAMQSPLRFQASVAGNIALERPDPVRIDKACRAGAAHRTVRELPLGLNQTLGWVLPGAVDLSPGQWQRLALARAMYRDAPILLLDEPTACMDPWTEAEWLAGLRDYTAGRTVILITHRFAAARYADRICVMDRGQVAESGTHEQLVTRGGLYSEGWRLQTEQELAV
ncbi:MAG: ABC transporter ATP-binding protein [Bryobacteraceae bacterium]